MARYAVPVIAWLLLGLQLGTSVISFSGLLNVQNVAAAESSGWLDPYLWQVLLFTLKQAFFSVLVSLLFALPIALVLYRLPPGRLLRTLLSLSLMAFVMPTLALITAIVLLFGKQSLTQSLFDFLGFPPPNIYGLTGILLAHVYLNLPFAVRSILLRLQQLPPQSVRLAQQMRLSRREFACQVLWPHCRSTITLVAGFIFILCFNSFAVVLTLGGGPQSTTLEVAIYQALTYDFNPAEALSLAWLQLLTAGGLMLWLLHAGQVSWLGSDRTLSIQPSQPPLWTQLIAVLYLSYLCLPVIALAGSVVTDFPDLSLLQPLLAATARSLLLAIVAAAGACAIAWALLYPVRRYRLRGNSGRQLSLEWAALHHLPLPAMVLGTGLYILAVRSGFLETLRLPLLFWLNVLIVLPYAFSQFRPHLFDYDDRYQRLLRNWRPRPWQRIWLEWKALLPVMTSALALTGLLALGDVALFALFGPDDWTTLPWLIYQYAGSYRLSEATLASLILLGLCAALIPLLEKARASH